MTYDQNYYRFKCDFEGLSHQASRLVLSRSKRPEPLIALILSEVEGCQEMPIRVKLGSVILSLSKCGFETCAELVETTSASHHCYPERSRRVSGPSIIF